MRLFSFFLIVAFSATVLLAQQSDPEPKVLLIGLDGIRVDILAQAHTPHFDELVSRGTFSDSAYTRMPTVSGPGWSSMVTGVWAEKHGVMGNNFSANRYDRYPDFLTRLEQVAPQTRTFAVLNWPPLGTTGDGGPMISDAIDIKVNIQGDSLGYGVADHDACEVAEQYLSVGDIDAGFVYLGNTDVVGHGTGSLSADYRHSIEWADSCIGRLMASLAARPNASAEDWLILMSSDHGRNDAGGHGGDSVQERTIFYLASGTSARRGRPEVRPAIVDIAVTALTHLGIPIMPEWELDGRVVGLR